MFAHPVQLIIVLVLVLLLFGGRGRISSIMGDLAKGITSFRSGLKDSEKQSEDDAAEEAIDVTPKEKKDDKKSD